MRNFSVMKAAHQPSWVARTLVFSSETGNEWLLFPLQVKQTAGLVLHCWPGKVMRDFLCSPFPCAAVLLTLAWWRECPFLETASLDICWGILPDLIIYGQEKILRPCLLTSWNIEIWQITMHTWPHGGDWCHFLFSPSLFPFSSFSNLSIPIFFCVQDVCTSLHLAFRVYNLSFRIY